jgi:hypothetical protein
MDALTTCNACDVNQADPESLAGYCIECEAEARAQTEE